MAALSKLASKALARMRSATFTNGTSVHKRLRRFISNPELLDDLPPEVLRALADGDVSVSLKLPKEPSSPGGWEIPAAATAAAAAGVIGGGAVARDAGNRQRATAGPESLSDGLDGAPQSDLTPEPVAETQSAPSRQQLMNQPPESIGGEIMPEGFESLPFDQMHPAYQKYINSLPENSPERKAAREKRQDAADARMDDFQEGMDIATNAEMSREELARLRDGGNVWGPRPDAPLPPGVTRGPNHGTLSVKPSAENGWRSYAKPGVDYDPEEHDGTGMNDAEMQKWIESRGPGSDLQRRYDPRGYEAFDNERSLRAREASASDWNDRHHGEEQDSYWVQDGMLPTQYQTSGTRLVRDPVTGEAVNVPVNQPMASTPLKRYTLTEQGRKASTGVSAAQANESGRVGNRELDDMDRASVDRRMMGLANRIAKQTGRPVREVYAELKENGNVYQDPQTGGLGVRASTDATLSIRDAQNKQLADRRRRVASQAMLAGANPRKNAVNAFDMLGNPDLTQEQRDTLERALDPRSREVQVAEAEQEAAEAASPSSVAMAGRLMQEQLTNASAAGAAAANQGKAGVFGGGKDRAAVRAALAAQFAGNPLAQAAALTMFDAEWPESTPPPPASGAPIGTAPVGVSVGIPGASGPIPTPGGVVFQ